MRRVVEQSPYYSTEFFATLGVGLDDEYLLVECRSCSLVYIGNPPAEDVLDNLYAVDDTSLADHVAVFARPARLSNQLHVYARVLEAVAERGSFDARGVPNAPIDILDFGAAVGAGLLSIAREGFPYRAFAVESSPTLLRFLSGHGVTACPGLQAFDAGQRFDAIILNDVIEHVKEPVSLLRALAALLKPHGVMWLAVPDFSAWRLKLELSSYRSGGSFSTEINPLEHLSYFNPAVLDRLAAGAGMSRVQHRTASIRVNRDGTLLHIAKGLVRGIRDILRVQRGVDHRYATAALFELAPGLPRN